MAQALTRARHYLIAQFPDEGEHLLCVMLASGLAVNLSVTALNDNEAPEKPKPASVIRSPAAKSAICPRRQLSTMTLL
jgi:hypothetical protein